MRPAPNTGIGFSMSNDESTNSCFCGTATKTSSKRLNKGTRNHSASGDCSLGNVLINTATLLRLLYQVLSLTFFFLGGGGANVLSATHKVEQRNLEFKL